MAHRNRVRVSGQGGLQGTVDATEIEPGGSVSIALDTGEHLTVPAAALLPQQDGSYLLSAGSRELEQATSPGEPVVIPVLEETLQVDKRTVETGRVRVVKTVHEREEVIDEPLLREEVEVTRIPMNRYLDKPAAVRTEGETTIIPVMEEVLVVEKKLVLKEEVHLTRRRSEHRTPQQATLRSEEANVERVSTPRTSEA